jgi:DNA primase
MLDYYKLILPYIDKFSNYKINENELISCSPLREDNKPSFSLNLDNGLWIDFGCDDTVYSKGNIIKLLSLLSDTPYEDIANGIELEKNGSIDLEKEVVFKFNLDYKINKDIDVVVNFIESEYLLSRGIDYNIQKMLRTFEEDSKLGIPIFNIKNKIINIKYRLINKKYFYYEYNNSIIDDFYNLNNVVYKYDYTYITESEIDTMTLLMLNLPSIALMGSFINDNRLNMLVMYFNKIILALDNDKKGIATTNYIISKLSNTIKISMLVIGKPYKDVNEVGVNNFYDRTSIIDIN